MHEVLAADTASITTPASAGVYMTVVPRQLPAGLEAADVPGDFHDFPLKPASAWRWAPMSRD